MEEKKLTDEEIIKALEMNCLCVVYGKENCESCLLFEKDCRILPNAVVELIHRQKAEIERLTEEANQDTVTHIDICTQNLSLRKQNAELQKQVDALKLDLENWKKAAYGYKYAEEQAVKDTAKEILHWLIEHTYESCIFETYFRERFGVEVEE